MNSKPVLFVDFDRTLFDTERYYLWLGQPRSEQNQALIDGTRELPDFSSFDFSDSEEFLTQVRKKFELAILSFVKLEYSPQQAELQQKKFDGSGLVKYCADVIITTGLKSEEVKKYLIGREQTGARFAFIDDEPMHLSSMKDLHPKAFCVLLWRGGEMTGIQLPKSAASKRPDVVVSDLSQAAKALAGF